MESQKQQGKNTEVQGKTMENPRSNIAPILLCYCCFQTTTNNTFKHKPIVTDFCTSYFAVHSKRYCKWSYKYYNLLPHSVPYQINSVTLVNCLKHGAILREIINRPDVAGAVLHTPP